MNEGECALCGAELGLVRHHWFDARGVEHERFICNGCNVQLGELCREYYPPWRVQVSLWERFRRGNKIGFSRIYSGGSCTGLDLDRWSRPERLRDMAQLYSEGTRPRVFDLAVKYDVSIDMIYKDRAYLRMNGLANREKGGRKGDARGIRDEQVIGPKIQGRETSGNS